jgi:signal transduction histidine kinase
VTAELPSMPTLEPQSRASMPRRVLPLERKLPLLILALFTVVLALGLGTSYYEVRRAAEEAAAARLVGLSQVLGSLVEQQIATRIALMTRVAREPAVRTALREPGRAPSAEVGRALGALTATRADTATPPMLLTADGQPIGGLQLLTPREPDGLRDALHRLAATGDSTLITPLRSIGGRAGYIEAVAVHDGDGRLLGYLAQERGFNTNPRSLQPLRDIIGSDIDFYFRNRRDQTWARIDGSIAPPPLASAPAMDSLTRFTHATGDLLAATRPVTGTPFLLTVERPMSQILARPLTTLRILLVLGIVLAVLGAAMVWAISRRLVRPLAELTSAAESLATGRYDRRVAVGDPDEVGRLAAAFNRMAEEVEVSSDASARSLARLTETTATQEFLAGAADILARSLSDESLISGLAEYCVPRLADYCSIHVADEDGAIRRIATAHRDPDKGPMVRALVARYPYHVDGPGEVPAVIRSREPVLLPHVDVAAAIAQASDADAVALLRQVAPSSFMCVPLVVRGRAFGAISFTMTDSGRVYSRDDLEIANELARRTAVAIDNALIFRRSIDLRLDAEAASNAKSDFLAKMSHEIRTPINAMMGYAELLQMGLSGPVNAKQAAQLGRIRDSGNHLTSLIGEILDLSKIEAGQMQVESVVASAPQSAEAALTMIRPQAAAKGIEVVLATASDTATEYLGDPKRVHQILTNLLTNAVKFTPPGGRVSIECGVGAWAAASAPGHEARWACISVQDTGVGIAADDIDRIFQPFVQVDSGYTRSQGGTGLGLTISRSLAQMMGGDIALESTVGVGSIFTLWLPSPNRARVSD